MQTTLNYQLLTLTSQSVYPSMTCQNCFPCRTLSVEKLPEETHLLFPSAAKSTKLHISGQRTDQVIHGLNTYVNIYSSNSTCVCVCVCVFWAHEYSQDNFFPQSEYIPNQKQSFRIWDKIDKWIFLGFLGKGDGGRDERNLQEVHIYSLMKQRYVNLSHSFITKYLRILILGKLNHEQCRLSISKP